MEHHFRILTLAIACFCSATAFAQASQGSDDVARGLFEAGRAAYDSGSYQDALNFFQQAYEYSDRPRLLYNIGQSADRLRMDRTALSAFRRYLELVPDADNVVEVENRIRALEPLVVEDAPVVKTPVTTPPVAPTPVQTAQATQSPIRPTIETSNGPGVAPWLVVGASGAAVVTGIVLFAVGTQKISTVESAPPMSTWSGFERDAESGPALKDAGLTTMVLGAVGALVGITWILTAEPSQETTVAVSPNGLTLKGTL